MRRTDRQDTQTMIARKGMLTRERKASERKFQLKFKSQSCNASRQKQQQSLSVCPNQQQRNER
jgi:hypothetical protein